MQVSRLRYLEVPYVALRCQGVANEHYNNLTHSLNGRALRKGSNGLNSTKVAFREELDLAPLGTKAKNVQRSTLTAKRTSQDQLTSKFSRFALWKVRRPTTPVLGGSLRMALDTNDVSLPRLVG